LSWRSSTCRERGSRESRRSLSAELERLAYVFTINCDHLGERTASAAYILTLKVSYDCRPAPQHVMSWHLGQIRRGAVHVAGVPTTVAHGPADHAYEVAASAEDPASRVGRSRPIASFGLFHGVLLCAKGLVLHTHDKDQSLLWFCIFYDLNGPATQLTRYKGGK
jgi:hypothetical protein